MTKRSLVAALGCVAVLGCASEEAIDDGFLVHPPPAPDDVVRVFTPIYEIPAGDELFTCMTVPLDNTEDLLVAETSAWQTGGGHHVLILMVDADARIMDAPHECTDADMAVPSLRFVGAGSADGGSIALPANLALRIPPGRKLLLQSHHINTSSEPVRVQDAIDLRRADPDSVEFVAGAYAHVDTRVELGARASTTRTVDCPAPVDGMQVPWMFAHMHEYGAHAKIELVRDGETQVLYDEPWDPAFRDHFPYVVFDPPLTLRATDHLRTTCTWDNSEPDSILFPKEMCATFMPYYPAEGTFWVCNQRGVNVEL